MIFKLLILVGLIMVVLFAFKAFEKAKKAKLKGGGGQPNVDRSDTAGEIDAEDMVQCSVCGEYVAASGAESCGRDDCPY